MRAINDSLMSQIEHLAQISYRMRTLDNRSGADFHSLIITAGKVLEGLGLDERSVAIKEESRKAEELLLKKCAGDRCIFTGYLDIANKPIYIGDIMDHYHFGKEMRMIIKTKEDGRCGDQYIVRGHINDKEQIP